MRYPATVLDVLRERCALTASSQVADIGAGTGMLAELLLEAGCTVTAIEPNAEMRGACERLTSRFPRLTVIAASAEQTGLASASLELVTAGRAFHWFDRERSLAEFARVLKPGGWVALVTNRRAHDGSEQALAYERILLEHGRDYAQVRGSYRSYEGAAPAGAESFMVRMPGWQRLTLAAFLGQTQSLSVTPLPGAVGYAEMQAALCDFFSRWSRDGVLTLETMCEVVGWRLG